MHGLTPSGDGFLAAGCLSRATQDAAVWWSPDGAQWTLQHVPAAGREERLFDIAVQGDSAVAVGVRLTPGPTSEDIVYAGLVWVSGDGGHTWSVQSHEEGLMGSTYSPEASAWLERVIMFDDRVIAAGPAELGERSDIWVGTWVTP
jgi:hypothetical protein